MLQEANGSKRQELLQHANADQINAVSELVLNFLKNKIPVTPPMLAKLQPYKKVLRDLGRRRHSVKKRRAVVSPTKRTRLISRTPSRVMSMFSLTLATWMRLLQEANRATDQWKDACSYWKHKYRLLYREYQHILKSRLCESCRTDRRRGTLLRV